MKVTGVIQSGDFTRKARSVKEGGLWCSESTLAPRELVGAVLPRNNRREAGIGVSLLPRVNKGGAEAEALELRVVCLS